MKNQNKLTPQFEAKIKEFVDFEDISKYLDGYARVVQYEYAPRKDGKSGHQNKIISVSEGRYQEGFIVGFAR
jgi:hypothetical protein